MTEVSLKLPGGEQLVAVVTLESVRNLPIAVGKEAIALIKTPWVMLMTESSDIRLSARNCLQDKVRVSTMGLSVPKWSSS